MKHPVTIGDLIRLHHQPYEEDIPFWKSRTDNDSLILELGCGHGRVSVPLAKDGRKVIGIDRDWSALSFLESTIASQGKELREQIQLIQADILNFHSSPAFKTVILPCNTFSTFNHHSRMRLLDRVAHSLLPGGAFITSIPNPERGMNLSQPTIKTNDETEIESQFVHPETGLPVQVSSRLIAAEEKMTLEWIYDLLLPDGTVERFIKSTKHYFESLDVYRDEFQMAGLPVEVCLGDFSGGEYDRDSPYMILIGRSSCSIYSFE